MRRLTVMLFALAALASVVHATPWFTQDPRTLPEGRWRVEEHLLYTEVDNALVDGDTAPLAAGEFTALVAHTRVRYGAKDNLTVFVDAPWVRKRWTAASGAVSTNDGLGDMLVVAKYKYHDSRAHHSRRALALSYKPHTGDTRGLAPPLALGSGSSDFNLLHLWEWDRPGTTWYANLGYSLTGDRADLDRDPGDALLFNVAVDHSVREGWNLVGELNGRYEGNAEAGGAAVAGTGSTVISLSPGVQHVRARSGGRLTTLEAGVQVPVWERGDAPTLPDFTVYVGGYSIF